MRTRRILATLGGVLVCVPSLWAQTHSLAEPVQAGQCFQITLDMKLAGELRVTRGGRPAPLKLEASAAHRFTERVLNVGDAGTPSRVARLYDDARATIATGVEKSERTLRPERRLIVAQWHKDTPLVYSPAGALRRPELEVIGEHFDTLNALGLLPAKPVNEGDTWKIPSGVVQGLCQFEGLTEHTLQGKFDAVKDGVATVSVAGSATGIDAGALAKLTIKATAKFDTAAKKLVEVTWAQADEREPGPASPAMKADLTVTMKRTAVGTPRDLDLPALVSVPDGFAPPASATVLDYADPDGRYAMYHTRDWRLVAQTADHAVFRVLERGDFVAQATVAPWKAAAKGGHLPEDEFKAAMNRTPGWEPKRELQAGEVPGEGKYVYRYSVLGELDGVEVLQNFFLVAGPGGEQVVVTVTMTPKQAEKLGARDLALVGSLEVPAKK